MKTLKEKMYVSIVPYLGYLLIKFLTITMRVDFVGFDKVWSIWRDGRNVIAAFWHGRLIMMPLVLKKMYKGKGLTVLISQHRDGEMVSKAMNRFGVDSVRGSTTRGWLGGIKGILKAIKAGRDIAITPDGPKGPRFKAQTGIINIASKTGLPIIPITFGASKKKPSRAGMPLFSRIHFQEGSLSAVSL